MLDKSGDKVRRMFAQIAPRYDLMNHVLSLNIDKSWRTRTLNRLDLSSNAPVLDVCTGTGDLAISMALKSTGRYRVIGADFCLPMLELARQKQLRFDESGSLVSFIEADTQQLPFHDNTFQAVTVAFGIRNVADTRSGLVEMIRVCKPGGQVAILEFSRPTWPILKQLYDGYFRWILPMIGQAMARNSESAYNYLPESVRQFPSGRAMIELLERTGLKDVRAWPMTFGVATLYIGRKEGRLR
ncbi:MAG: bifunctional demethylmenaquinone methyltransferase/2-methoxy-6-polyprenyl-1,4-benzoquinol methylase UbiE [Pirellulaceae bacterium]|nr:bifunctional demethylmenaquinone methyltransferase/2-methoxy-6-polyprenyl-1,4-benzoquinol methylase UbiE [Pirellulaceae bacterium]